MDPLWKKGLRQVPLPREGRQIITDTTAGHHGFIPEFPSLLPAYVVPGDPPTPASPPAPLLHDSK